MLERCSNLFENNIFMTSYRRIPTKRLWDFLFFANWKYIPTSLDLSNFLVKINNFYFLRVRSMMIFNSSRLDCFHSTSAMVPMQIIAIHTNRYGRHWNVPMCLFCAISTNNLYYTSQLKYVSWLEKTKLTVSRGASH